MPNSRPRVRPPRRPVAPHMLACPFERLTALARAMFDAPHAVVSLAEDGMVRVQAGGGISVTAIDRDNSVTHLMMEMGPGSVLVAEDCLEHPLLSRHKTVTAAPWIRWFVGATVSDKTGRPIGVLGVRDVKPRPAPSEAELVNLRLLARMAGEIVDQTAAARDQAERLEMLRLSEEMAGVGQWRLDLISGQVEWSDEVYRIHGVTRDSFDPMLSDALGFYHPDDQEVIAGLVHRAVTLGEPYKVRLRVVRRGGEVRLALAHGEAERDEDGRVVSVFGVFQDVTEQERLLSAARRNERRYRLLAENTGDVITRVGVDGASKYISPAIEALLGWRYEEMTGQALDYVHPEDRPAALDAMRQAVREGQSRIEHRALHRDGRVVWVECNLRAVDGDGARADEVVVVIRDISARKVLEAELTQARDRAEAAARAKAEFLANMSHELRTPLTSVIGFSGLLKQSGALAGDERRYVDRIATASDALLAVINDILDYSKLEADAVEIEPAALDPRALAASAAALVEAQCEAQGLSLTVEVAAETPATLTGDVGRLRQVLLNFLSNAVKFTPRGGISLKLGGRMDGDRWRLRAEVTDSGIGIAPDKLGDVFDRFTQADASTTRLYGGTGLGLAISRRLIEMMGGQVGVDSRPGEGSTFWLEAPLSIAEGGAGAAVQAEEAPMRAARILVADDAAANRELVTAILGGMGLEVEVVCDGAEAMRAAATGAHDLILMDMHMPVMDGLDATRAIRAAGATTPIIALTANVGPDAVRRSLEAGMDGHLAKPIRIGDLAACLQAWLSEPGEAASRSA